MEQLNNLENQEILSPKVLTALNIILDKEPNTVFGGSLCLNAVGLINRPVKDIDIMLDKNNPLSPQYYNYLKYISDARKFNDENDIKNYGSITTTDVNGDLIKRIPAIVNGVHVCIFELPSVHFSFFKLYGRTIKIQNVNEAILAKRAYSKFNYKSAQKHRDDLREIEKNLNYII